MNRRKNSAAFSAALRERRETAHRLRPKMAYGNLHPLNVAEEKARFLREWEAYERGRRATRPDDPRFEYADPEAARLQMKEYGAPRDFLLAHAERIMSLKRGRFGSDGSYERAAWGDRVDVGGLEATVRRYLEHLGVEHRVEIEWHDALATPSMTTSRGSRRARGASPAARRRRAPQTFPRGVGGGAVGSRDRDALRLRAQRRRRRRTRAGHVRARRRSLGRHHPT